MHCLFEWTNFEEEPVVHASERKQNKNYSRTKNIQPFFLPSGSSLLWEQPESRLQVIQGSLLQAPVPETRSIVSDRFINPAQLCRTTILLAFLLGQFEQAWR